MEKSALYKEKYGAWAGFPNGHKPDYTRCCEDVLSYVGNWPRHYQCQRKRGYGPDKAYCKQHDPEAVKARQDAADAKHKAKWNQERYSIHGRTFFNALQQIADGHNDARGLAQEVIKTFKEGEY